MHLPPEMVPLLDALYAGYDLEEPLRQAQRWVDTTLATLEAESSYFISDSDEAALENALFLMRELQGDVARAALQADGPTAAEYLRKKLANVIPYLRNVARDRLYNWFLDVEPLDALLVAAISVAQGRGKPEAVRALLPPALVCTRDLHALFRARRADLPSNAQTSISAAFDEVTRALEMLAEWLENPAENTLRHALKLLRNGGEPLAHVDRWSREGPRVQIPLAGPALDAMLDAAHRGDDRWRTHAARAWPRLRDFVEKAREQLPLRLENREQLLDAVEIALDNLEATLEEEPVMLDALDRAVHRVEQAFSALRGGVVRVERVHGQRYRELAQLISGVWFGTVPLLTLLSRAPHLLTDDDPAAIADALDEYLQSGERACLQAALEAVVQAEEQPSALHDDEE